MILTNVRESVVAWFLVWATFTGTCLWFAFIMGPLARKEK